MTCVSRQNFNSLTHFAGAFFLSTLLSIACLFSDFFHVESRYDFQRYALVVLISFLPSMILVMEFFRRSNVNKYVSTLWFFPAFVVLSYSYITIDQYALFSLEGLMLALFLITISIGGAWAKKSEYFFGIIFSVIYGLVVVCFFYSTSTIMEYLFIVVDGL